MILPTDLLNEVDRIKINRQHGARELTYMALLGLKRCLKQFKTKDEREIIKLLLTSARLFAEARPNMAPIANSMSAVVYSILKGENQEGGLKVSIFFAVDEQLRLLEESFKSVVSKAAGFIKNGDVIVTCSYSSTVLEALIKANRLGRRFKVLALSSPSPDGSISYGVLLYDKLHLAKVETEIVYEEKKGKRIEDMDFALVGADSILPDGSVLNGSPTLMLAEETKAQSKPFHVACETWKINTMSLLGFTPELEVGMDKVPSKLVTTIIIEHGILKPMKVRKYANKFLNKLKTIRQEELLI